MNLRKTIIFSPATYNLSETTRGIEVAKICHKKFNVIFISYGGQFENLIKKENFELIKLNPRLTKEKINHLYKINWMEKIGEFFTLFEIEEQVKNEIEVLKKIKPACIVTGFNLSSSISCRVTEVPLVYLTQSTFKISSILNSDLGIFPDLFTTLYINWLPKNLLIQLALKLYLSYGNYILFPYNKIGVKYGLKPFKNIEELWEGNYNLVAEPKGFCKLELPSNYYYIGPLITKLDLPIPDEIINIPKDKPIIYFAMGSSGQQNVIKKIIESFQDMPYKVIAPIKPLLENIYVNIPKNVMVTDWLPAYKVNQLADISLIHGGIGTLMTACLSGTPIVSIPLQFEQELNAQCLVSKGIAIRLNKYKLNSKNLFCSIDFLLNSEEVKCKVKEFQKTVQEWLKESPEIILDFFEKRFL